MGFEVFTDIQRINYQININSELNQTRQLSSLPLSTIKLVTTIQGKLSVPARRLLLKEWPLLWRPYRHHSLPLSETKLRSSPVSIPLFSSTTRNPVVLGVRLRDLKTNGPLNSSPEPNPSISSKSLLLSCQWPPLLTSKKFASSTAPRTRRSPRESLLNLMP